MPDLLVRLYALPTLDAEARVIAAGIAIRRALPPEAHLVKRWVGRHFNEGWVSEATMAMAHLPPTLWLAVRDNAILGFACHDATAKGFFGPTGVDEAQRGHGIGEALLIATLRGMREAGYGYAIIGGAGPVAFYQKRLDALVIPGSVPGIYAGMLDDDSVSGPPVAQPPK
jgi:GNAT superfamily N-acetyltransferase